MLLPNSTSRRAFVAGLAFSLPLCAAAVATLANGKDANGKSADAKPVNGKPVNGKSVNQTPGYGRDGILLHNGWKITPAGQHAVLGDMLLGCAPSPDGTLLALTNGGADAHHIYLVDSATGKVRQTLPVARAQSGLAWSRDGGTLYVSGGNSGRIHVLSRRANGSFETSAPLVLPDIEEKPAQDSIKGAAYLSGLALSADGQTLFAANLATDTIYALALDAESGAVPNSSPPSGNGANAKDANAKDAAEKPVVVRAKRLLEARARPGCVRLSPDGSTLYVSLWGAGSVLALDPPQLETKRTLAAGRHPNDLLFSRDGRRLFVSCGNDDAVLALDPITGQASERIAMTLTPRAPAGATPSALALSPDERTLFVANSDNNAVAVVDVSRTGRSVVRGFIPTAYYPTTVAVSPDGKRLFVGSGKGLGTGPNAPPRALPGTPLSPPDQFAPRNYPYIATLLSGVLSTVAVPDETRLAIYTRQVLSNTPYRDALLQRPAQAPRPGTNPIPSRVGDASPIKHVLYIIKENRTYDQVFGDFRDKNGVRRGNGDPALTLFDEEVTPNHHALAREYVLLDNFYANGEVSVDGHHWSNGAYVPDAMQRTWPAQYGGKGAPPIRYGDFGDPLAETPGGRIWDLCERAGLSYRTYYYHTDKNKSEEWAQARRAHERDFNLADIFIKDLKGFEAGNNLPRFMVMALSEDHTSGTRPGAFTPKACVGSNDLGLGKIVEACSRSKFWKQMAIVVLEDDAQAGPDHVDAHRTVALVISPYTRRSHVDSTFYTTVSMLRTIELILGLPAMSQFDAAATPMYASFTNAPDFTPYLCRPARIDLHAKNPATAYGAKASLALDFSAPDRLTVADEDTLNRVLWHSIKGEGAPYPAPVRRALLRPDGRPVSGADEDDDD